MLLPEDTVRLHKKRAAKVILLTMLTQKRKDELKFISDYFKDKLEAYGVSFKSLDWGSQEGQSKRFLVLAEIGICNGDHVLDVGCGLADFYVFLRERTPNAAYTGIDVTEMMVDSARARFPEATIECTSLENFAGGSFDWVLASGLFYLNCEDPYGVLDTSIRKMLRMCKKGVGFNCLSDRRAESAPREFRANALRVLSLALELSPFVVLRHDYHQADFTVYIYKVPR